MASMFSLEGKVALVTGASYGIGFAIASGFAEAGATIVFNDINQDLDNMTKDTPNNGILVSLTNDLILPIWIGRSTSKGAKNAIFIAADDSFGVQNGNTQEIGIFEVSQMSTNTLMKIIENYNKEYNQFALLPE